MTRARWAVLAAVVALAGGGGCVCCDTRLARANREAGPTCEVPLCERQHVYAVLVNGACPAGGCSLEGLREGLAARGFVKTYFGQVTDALWLAREMRAVAACDPAARFVVVGSDVGGPVAAHLARQAAADKVTVDALVLLHPVGMSGSADCPVRTVLVTCGGECAAPHTEQATVAGATRLTLPGHPATVDIVMGLLTESAAKVELPPAVFDAPPEDGRPPRDLTPPPGVAPEWLFLHDDPGFHPAPLSPLPPPSSRPNAGPIAPALVPPGGYPPPPRLPRPQLPWIIPVPGPIPAPVPGQPLPAPRPLTPAP